MLIIKSLPGSFQDFLALAVNRWSVPLSHPRYSTLLENLSVVFTSSFEDTDSLKSRLWNNKERIRLVIHDNTKLDECICEWAHGEDDLKEIYIPIKSHYIEYRLNNLKQFEKVNNMLNHYAVDVEFKNYKAPVALSEIKRMINLRSGRHPQVTPGNGIQFDFGNFFDERLFCDKFKEVTDYLGIDYSQREMATWYHKFKHSQTDMLARAELIKKSIRQKKFLVKNFTENEKGIIIGSQMPNFEDIDEDLAQTMYYHQTIY